MAGAFVIVAKAAAPMANLENRFRKVEKTDGFNGPNFRNIFSLPENGSEGVLRKNMFDVGDEQFLVLLFVVQSDGEDRFDLSQEVGIRTLQKLRHLIVD